MRFTQRTRRIGASCLLALLFMGGAYFISGPNPFTSNTVSAESTEELLKEYASKDTDKDALPDWQEALYGTDPSKADTNGDGVSDGEAARTGLLSPTSLSSQLPSQPTGEELLLEIPGSDPATGSITEQFSRSFLEYFTQASNGQPMDEATQDAVSTKLLQDFSGQVGELLVSKYSNVSVRTNASVSTQAYAGSVERAFFTHDLSREDSNAVVFMEALIQNGDDEAADKLTNLSSAYGAMADDIGAVQVPPSLSATHVKLVRSLETLSRTTKIIANFESDPVATMGALAIHQEQSDLFVSAVNELATTLLASGEPAQGQPGFVVIAMARVMQEGYEN